MMVKFIKQHLSIILRSIYEKIKHWDWVENKRYLWKCVIQII